MLGPRLRLLRLVGVRIPDEELQPVQHVPGESVLGKHALHGKPQDFRRFAVPEVDRGDLLLSAIEPGVPLVFFGVHLGAVVFVARVHHIPTDEPHFVGIHDDDKVAAVDMRGVIGSMFAHQHGRDLCREPADRLTIAVDDEPSRLTFAQEVRGFQKRGSLSDSHNRTSFTNCDAASGYESPAARRFQQFFPRSGGKTRHGWEQGRITIPRSGFNRRRKVLHAGRDPYQAAYRAATDVESQAVSVK